MTTVTAVERLIADGRINELSRYIESLESENRRLYNAEKTIVEVNELLGDCKNLEMPAVKAFIATERYGNFKAKERGEEMKS